MINNSPTKLSEYLPYPFLIPSINIDFNIEKDKVIVETLMVVEPKFKKKSKLFLNGIGIKLISISINGRELEEKDYNLSDQSLSIDNTPLFTFELKIKSSIDPFKNTSLEGLYLSSNMLTTQCEAEGFRRICYHPDRPDILSKYLIRIESDISSYPILLSNGNKKYSGKIIDKPNRHEVVWEDPFPKPCYLFALVAGKLKEISDTYITNTGRKIFIKLYVEDGDEKFTTHAINSLKKAMKWDEDKFDLEYDLDEYKIVAVRHFNMGAMENKGLNIFNSKLVLADSSIATDDELERIESVIAHEYFHNWTGNRITCRDWFQLSLKEGLTVYRDQSFTADLHDPGLKRIEDVSFLRNFQFAEDIGPTSHAVKPKEYISIDNFYTTTIYEKGSELIRMLELLLGYESFIRGIKFYIKTFDGSSATTEDFIHSVIKGSNGDCHESDFNIEQFINWYYKSGTPKVYINHYWDQDNSTLNVSFEQNLNDKDSNKNIEMVIPILYSCYSRDNSPNCIIKEKLFILDEYKKTLKIKVPDIEKKAPILSVFRRFSAPVNWYSDLTLDDYLFLFINDDDYFTRWDSAQILYLKILQKRIENQQDLYLENCLLNSIKQSINNLEIKDSFFLANLLTIPGLSELESSFTEVDPISIYKECLNFQRSVGIELIDDFISLSEGISVNINKIWPEGKGERKLLGTLWSYLALAGDLQVRSDCLEAINNSSMTLVRAAINALKPLKCSQADEASNLFYELWNTNPVVLDSWFAYEASRSHTNTIDVIEKLLSHPKFDWMAPNAIRAVLGGFAKNIEAFHSSDGQGYFFMAEKLIEIDKINPITASRMVKVFSRWKSYIKQNKLTMHKAILTLDKANISTNTREVLSLILK